MRMPFQRSEPPLNSPSIRLVKEENAFREIGGKTDKPLAYYYYLIRMFPTVKNVRRFATNEIIQNFSEHLYVNSSVGGRETSFKQAEEKGPDLRISRSINGELVFDDDPRTFGLISEEGTTDFDGTLKFELREGPDDQSHAHHWNASQDLGATIIFVLHVAAERFEWLWREMTLRPHGELLLQFSMRVYQYEVDYHLSEPYHRQEYYVEPESLNAISEISFIVRDTYPVTGG